jgi:hypothetical protein
MFGRFIIDGGISSFAFHYSLDLLFDWSKRARTEGAVQGESVSLRSGNPDFEPCNYSLPEGYAFWRVAAVRMN